MQIHNAVDFFGHQGELVEMGGEEAIGVDLCVQVFADAPGNTESFVGAGASAQLVNQHKTLVGR